MISYTITPSGCNPINIRVPENGKELPFNRYFPAKYEYERIVDLFVDAKETGYLEQFEFLRRVIQFLSQVLAIDPNDMAGFNTGSFEDNFNNLIPIKDRIDYENIDGTIFELYGLCGDMFKEIEPPSIVGEYEFEHKGETYIIPKIFGKIDLFGGTPMPDMPTWIGIECCQLEKVFREYMNEIVPKNKKNQPVELIELSEDDRWKYFDQYYTLHLGILSCLVQKKGVIDSAWMQGQDAIDMMIKNRIAFFADIDTQTAINCFFFGLNISQQLEMNLLSNIGGMLQDQRLTEPRTPNI